MDEDKKYEVGRSPIHGRGIFARKRIRSGGYIGTFEGRPTKRDGTHVLWVIAEDGSMSVQGINQNSHAGGDFTMLIDLAAADTIQFYCYQSSGGNLGGDFQMAGWKVAD